MQERRAPARILPPTVVCKQFSRAFSLFQQLLPAASVSLSVRIKLGEWVHQHSRPWQQCQGMQDAPRPVQHALLWALQPLLVLAGVQTPALLPNQAGTVARCRCRLWVWSL